MRDIRNKIAGLGVLGLVLCGLLFVGGLVAIATVSPAGAHAGLMIPFAFGLMGATSMIEKAGKSTAAIATAYTIAKFGADDDTFSVASAATDGLVGIFQHTTTGAGKSARLMTHGISNIVYGGTIARGAPMTSDANGKAITASLGQNIIGFCLKSGVLNDVGVCRLAPGVLNSAMGSDGNTFKGLARATFDATGGKAIGTHGLSVNLPDNAIITRSWLEVITTFTSDATDAGTIAIGIPTDDVAGIVAAVAISAATDWDAGLHEGIQDGAAANMSVKTTAQRELSVDVAVEALLTGKFVLFCEYVISD